MEVLIIVYWVLGYIAVKNTIDADKVFIYSGNALFLRRAVLGLIFGWLFIPWWIIKIIISR